MINLEQYISLMEQPSEESVQSWGLQLLIILYMIGGIFFICKLIYSTYTILRVIRSGEKIRLQDISVIVTREPIAPFSWMRYIVISRTDWEENREEIITHELAHINYRHSWDVVVTGLCIVFHWFNPAAWLLKQELQNIHEFEADEYVIKQGIDAKKYQLLLIKKAVGTQRFTSMANSFNHSKLKKRITMMLKSKSNTWARLKYLYILPLAAIAITAFARPEISGELEKISSTKISELPLIKEVIQEKKDPVDVQKLVDENLKSIQDEVEIERAKIDEAVRKATAEMQAMEEEHLLQQEKINEQVEQAVRVSEEKIQKIMEERQKTMTVTVTNAMIANDNVVVFIDGVKADNRKLDNLKTEDIASITVQKNKDYIKQYGDNLEGVIFIEMKK